MLPLYVSRLPAQVRALRTALAEGDVETLRRLAHQLKGGGKTYGFSEVTRLAGDLEGAIDGAAPDLAPQVSALAEYLENIEGYSAS